VPAKESAIDGVLPPRAGSRPLLLIDIDGVVSLFGFPPDAGAGGQRPPSRAPRYSQSNRCPEGSFHAIDGVPHFLSTTAARHLLGLVSVFDPVWCSGWEEKADEYLPHLLGLPAGLPCLSFERDVGGANTPRAHWKIDAIDAYAGPLRPLAWLDDAFNDACHEWAKARRGPTLLVQTAPHAGLTEREAAQLTEWAESAGQASREGRQPRQAAREGLSRAES
jgi:hypothetical protein